MNICDWCKYAEWKKTKNGRLHPDKSGKCTFEIKPEVLPASFYYINKGSLCGGQIERGKKLNSHCLTFDGSKL